MKNLKLMKKITFSAGTIATVAAPILMSVSCGGKKYDLLVGIRPEDQPLWNSVATQFEKATGKTVGFKWVSDQNNDYSAWSGSNLMPDIAIADSAWAKAGRDRNWFDSLNMKNLVSNPEFIISGQDEEYKEDTKLEFNNQYFEKAMMDTMKTDGDTYNGLAVIYGPKISYAWKKIPQKGGGYFHIINDGSLSSGDDGEAVNLEYYVPDGKGDIIKAVEVNNSTTFKSATDEQKLLFSLDKDHHRLKTTENDIQEFLSRSASKTDVQAAGKNFKKKLEAPTINEIEAAQEGQSSAQELIISTGYAGYIQRLASVSKVLFDKIKNSSNNKIDNFKNNLSVGSVQDAGFAWSELAYGNAATMTPTNFVNTNMNSNNILKDNEVFKSTTSAKANYELSIEKKITKNNMSKLDRLNYLTNFGYFKSGFFGNSFIGGAAGEDIQDLFSKGKSLFIGDGSLWQWSSIKDKVHETFKDSNANDLLTSFGQPFQNTAVDGYAIKNGLKGEKQILAKKFLRFLMQKQVAADITGTKAISTIKSADSLQVDGVRGLGLANVSEKAFKNPLNTWADINYVIDLPLVLAKTSTTSNIEVNKKDLSPIFDPYNNFLMDASSDIWNDSVIASPSRNGMTLDDYAKGRTWANKKYQDSLII